MGKSIINSNFIKGSIRGLRDKLFFSFFRIFPIKCNKIVVSNFHGKGYGDNPKYIIEELLKQNNHSEDNKKIEIVWLVNSMSECMPKEIKKAKNTSWTRAFQLSTAKVWIDNARKPYGTMKRKKQLYIQTWHGPIGFKPVDKLLNEIEIIAYRARVNDSMMADYFISNSKWCTDMYKKAFYYDGKVLEIGSPRCDIFFHQNIDVLTKIKMKIGVNNNVRFVIYAPTFRGTTVKQNSNYKINYNMLLESMKKRFGGEWCLLIRMHPHLVNNTSAISNTIEDLRVIDISQDPDLYEYLAIADAFITDYSSAGFDAAYKKIPVFLFANDIEEYEKSRGRLLWDMNQLPFPFAQSESQLCHNILNFDNYRYLRELDQLFKEVGLSENGSASENTVNVIKQFIESK